LKRIDAVCYTVTTKGAPVDGGNLRFPWQKVVYTIKSDMIACHIKKGDLR
jgi:hypothetical protein